MSNTHGWKLTALAAATVIALGANAQQGQSDRSPSSQQQQQPDRLQRSRQGSDSRDVQGPESTQRRSDDRLDRQADQRSDRHSDHRTDQRSSETPFDELAEEHSNLSDFVAAVKSAGLAESLADGTDYTIFAPTNSAFDEQQGTSLRELMRTENRDQLVGLLRAHIVADDLDLTTARELPAATTIDGGQVDLTEQNGTLMVGSARVTDERGIRMGNIRVFPIDGVLTQNPSGSSPQASVRREPLGDR